MPLSQDEFGRAPPNVNHQAALAAVGQQVRDPQVNQAGFLPAGDHLDGKAQYLVRLRQEGIAVACLAQGLCGHGTHIGRAKSRDALPKAGQTGPASLHGFFAEVALGIESIALADGFLDVFHPAQVALFESADFQAKTVGAEVDGGKEVLGLHGVGETAPCIM